MVDWLLASAAEILAGLVLAGLAWVANSIRELRREIARSNSATDARLDRTEKQIVKVEELERQQVIRRLGEAEVKLARIEALALGEAALAPVFERINGLAKEVHSLGGKFESVTGSLEMIHGYLLGKGQGQS